MIPGKDAKIKKIFISRKDAKRYYLINNFNRIIMDENELSKVVVDCCYKIHTKLGPGLLESVYEEVLCYELRKNNLNYVRQNPVKVFYEEVTLDIGFIADIIVEDKLILELKSVETLKNVHYKQLLTYLRLNNKKLGLLINFNENLIKNGIKRIVNNL